MQLAFLNYATLKQCLNQDAEDRDPVLSHTNTHIRGKEGETKLLTTQICFVCYLFMTQAGIHKIICTFIYWWQMLPLTLTHQ